MVAAVVEAAAVGGSGAQRESLAGEMGAAVAAAAAAVAAAGSSLAGSLPLAPTPAWHTQQTGQRGDRVSQVGGSNLSHSPEWEAPLGVNSPVWPKHLGTGHLAQGVQQTPAQ